MLQIQQVIQCRVEQFRHEFISKLPRSENFVIKKVSLMILTDKN